MELSNYICILEIEEEKVPNFIEKIISSQVNFSVFKEPDLDNRVTSIALEPGTLSKKLCANLRLALK